MAVGLNIAVAALAFFATAPSLAMSCSAPPQQISSNIKNDIEAAIGRWGPITAGSTAIKTEVEVQNLMAKYPHAELLYVIQFMGATLCGILNESKSLSDSEKIARWTSFAKDSFGLLVEPGAIPQVAAIEVKASGGLASTPPPPPPTNLAPSPAITEISPLGITRSEWTRKYYYGFNEGSWNVIVASFKAGGEDFNDATARVAKFARDYPYVDFLLAPTVARDRSTNPRFACYIANVPDQATAQRLALWAQKVGIAPDAYVVRQQFD